MLRHRPTPSSSGAVSSPDRDSRQTETLVHENPPRLVATPTLGAAAQFAATSRRLYLDLAGPGREPPSSASSCIGPKCNALTVCQHDLYTHKTKSMGLHASIFVQVLASVAHELSFFQLFFVKNYRGLLSLLIEDSENPAPHGNVHLAKVHRAQWKPFCNASQQRRLLS